MCSHLLLKLNCKHRKNLRRLGFNLTGLSLEYTTKVFASILFLITDNILFRLASILYQCGKNEIETKLIFFHCKYISCTVSEHFFFNIVEEDVYSYQSCHMHKRRKCCTLSLELFLNISEKICFLSKN